MCKRYDAHKTHIEGEENLHHRPHDHWLGDRDHRLCDHWLSNHGLSDHGLSVHRSSDHGID